MSHFNLRDNLFKLFRPPVANHFPSIDGLRAISIIWLMGFHCIFFIGQFDLNRYLQMRDRAGFQWLKYGLFGVDIFFVISGFLIGYLLMQEWRLHGRLSIRKFYYRRALRLLPAYYAALLLCALLDSTNLSNAWANVLYVNNFVGSQQQFMPWTWSLAVEEQFYLLLPLLLLLILRLSRLRLIAVLLFLLAIAVCLRLLVIAHYGIRMPPYHPSMDVPRFSLYFDRLYDKLYARFGSFVLGVLAACLYLYTGLKQWMDQSPLAGRVLLVAALLLLAPLFATEVPQDSASLDSPAARVAIAYYPYIFSAAIAYILFYTLPGHRGSSLLGRLLSLRLWYPVSQLSYSAFLVHPLVILMCYRIALRPGQTVSTPMATVGGVGMIALSLLIAGILYMGIERPMMNRRMRYKEVAGER